MGFPTLKRENTVAIRFTKGKIEESHYREIIYHVLGVENNEVYGIAPMGPKKFILKVTTWGTYNRIVKDLVGKCLIIDDENEYEIDDLSTYKNRVRVTKVPFEMNDIDLRKLMERYGNWKTLLHLIKGLEITVMFIRMNGLSGWWLNFLYHLPCT